jgi:hypothetical protein
MFFSNSLHQGIHLSLRLRKLRVRLQAADHLQVVRTPRGQFLRRKGHGNPEPDLVGDELKTCRHDANDGVLLTIEQDVRTQNGSIAAVATLPQRITENDNLMRTRLIVLRSEAPTQQWLHTK